MYRCLLLNSHKSNDNLFNSVSGLVKMCNINNSRCKENHFYSLPFGQAEANIY